MRKVIVSNLMSLDGYLAGPKDELDWFIYDEGFDRYVQGLMGEVGAILYGRATYEFNSKYWPTAAENPAESNPYIVERMNSLPKIVFSTTLDKVEWGRYNNAQLIKKNIEAEVNKLKQQPGKDMVIFGSSNLVSSFLTMGLIDELRIFVHPIVLGSGKQMFTGVKERHKLKLVDSKPLTSGVVELVYEPVR